MVRRTCQVLCFAVAIACATTSCGERGEPRTTALSFERLDRGAHSARDTSGLAQGLPLVANLTLVRLPNGLVQVKGDSRLPEDTRIQLSLRRAGDKVPRLVTTATVAGGALASAPMLGEHGPLPAGDYRLELLASFDRDSQSDEVLRLTRTGHSLRGPGVSRSRAGDPVLFLTEVARL